MSLTVSSLKDKLHTANQSHLLQYWDELDETQQERLQSEIDSIDLELIQQLHQSNAGSEKWAELARQAQPPMAFRLQPQDSEPFSLSEAQERGQQALAAGQIGMILVAGGQGSRLGFEHPKGLFPIGPISQRTLFQVLLEKLDALGRHHGVTIPLCVMTSPVVHDETRAFLEEHRWFGYPAEACHLFCQGTMPAVDAESGRLLLSQKDHLFLSPDGHGGMLKAFGKSGLMKTLKTQGIQQLFYCQIDNPLAQVCDPATIGYHLLSQSEMSLQAVAKTDPLHKVGNVVSIDGQVQIIEYSDLPDEIAEQRNADGSLQLWAGSIAVHVFNLEFLERMATNADALPFHLARKKVPYINEAGAMIEPDVPNAIKFERFIFDLLPMAQRAVVIEVDPAEAFAPVKNAASAKTETAETSRQAMVAQAQRRLNEVGVAVPDTSVVEICPGLALDAERLKQVAQQADFSQEQYLQAK